MSSGSYLRDEYTSRINRVIDYVEANLDGVLTLEELAEVAGFSRFHFHRLFRSMVGETLNDFINRVRIEKAALHPAVTSPTTDRASSCTSTIPSSIPRGRPSSTSACR